MFPQKFKRNSKNTLFQVLPTEKFTQDKTTLPPEAKLQKEPEMRKQRE